MPPDTHQAPATPATTMVSFALESTSGGINALSALGGKVVVLFYEERTHTADNDELRRLLARYVRDHDLAEQLAVVPIANVSSYNFRPASDIARTAVRAVARRVGAEILLDWAGVLEAPPFSFSRGASNVALVDRAGRLVWHHAGRVLGPARTELFRALERALGDS